MKKNLIIIKSKTLLLLSLLVILPISKIFCEQKQNQKTTLEKEFKIELKKQNYSVEEVQNIIQIILEESDNYIEESYNNGYKQATLELKPELDYWKTKYDNQISSLWKDRLKFSFLSVGVGFSVGIGSGILISLKF